MLLTKSLLQPKVVYYVPFQDTFSIKSHAGILRNIVTRFREKEKGGSQEQSPPIDILDIVSRPVKHFLPAEILATSKDLNIGIRIRIGGPRRLSRLRLKCSLRRAYQLPKPLWLAVTMNFRLCSVRFRALSCAHTYTFQRSSMPGGSRGEGGSRSPRTYTPSSAYAPTWALSGIPTRDTYGRSSSSASVTAACTQKYACTSR